MLPSDTSQPARLDADQIHEKIRQRYAAVAQQPLGQFLYPVGRASAERLGYRRDLLERVPPAVADHFVGVGNPFTLGEPQPGWAVLDVGCGAGIDCQIAAQYVGPTGRVLGVDLSEEMLVAARKEQESAGLANLEFRQRLAESLPAESGRADLVLSNGVLNLAADKASAFREVYRVLKPGGRFQAADLLLVAELPPELRTDTAAWSN